MRAHRPGAKPARCMRAAFAALALLAVMLLLLRPLCLLWNGHTANGNTRAVLMQHEASGGYAEGGGDGNACCAGIEDGSLVKPSDSPLPGSVGTAGAVLFFAFAFFAPPGFLPRPMPGWGAFRSQRSFYARSASIRR